MRTNEAAELLAHFESQYLPFPPFVAAKDAIEADLELFRQSGLARHMLVLGEAGTGKTSLCRWLVMRYPMRRLSEGDRIPVLRIQIPPAATIIGICDAFLRALGDPSPNQGTTTAKSQRVVTLCRNCGVELMLVDEAQHLQDRGSAKTHYQVADFFKNLIDEISVPTVMLGLPRLVELLQTNDQLRRRFSRRIWLALGQSETDSIETECLQLFLSLASLIDVPVRSAPFGPGEMGRRIYFACDGRVAYVKKILFSALRRSLEQGHDVIDAELLQRAFSEEIWPEGTGPLNPFHNDFAFRRLDRGGEPFELTQAAAKRRQ
jgi:type II secretory pathway predicted ATPase ExeA